MKKLLCVLLALTMLACAFTGCSSSTDSAETTSTVKTVTDGVLTVATSPDFAPMEFVDASKSGQDQYVGFDVTLAKYIAEYMGLELEIKPMSFDACQVAVQMGSVDLSLSGFSYTEERAENYNLSDYYDAGNENEQVLITLASNGDKYADAANVEGLTVGYQTASLQEKFTTEQLPNATTVVFSDITTGIMQLKNGDFDCMAVAEGNATSIIENNPDIALTGFQFDVADEYKANLALIQKGNDALTEVVNAALAQAEEAGLYDTWYAEAKALAEEVGDVGNVSYDDEGNVAG